MPPQIEEVRAEMDKFDQGAPIPPLEISIAKQMWDLKLMGASDATIVETNTANAVGTASLNSQQFVTQMMRGNFLIALIGRGVLRDYLQDEASIEKVVVAAATFPCNKNDVAEAMILFRLTQSPPEVVREAKTAMKAEGFDVDNPKVDGRFIQWMKDNC